MSVYDSGILRKWMSLTEAERDEVRRRSSRAARRDGWVSGLTLGLVKRPHDGWIERAVEEVFAERPPAPSPEER